jgi:hypothetical protein
MEIDCLSECLWQLCILEKRFTYRNRGQGGDKYRGGLHVESRDKMRRLVMRQREGCGNVLTSYISSQSLRRMHTTFWMFLVLSDDVVLESLSGCSKCSGKRPDEAERVDKRKPAKIATGTFSKSRWCGPATTVIRQSFLRNHSSSLLVVELGNLGHLPPKSYQESSQAY